MKHHKILIDLRTWHITPYKLTFLVEGKSYTDYGFLCFRYIIGDK